MFSKEDSPDAPEILDATCISTSLAEKEFAQLINSLTKDKGCGHEPSEEGFNYSLSTSTDIIGSMLQSLFFP